ncbi:cryptochrome/photolyase family protein [Boseongicola aestuarii]|uniref:cryptochrome/photolyase family protein n=1 Tax=Boseongicola aestuarii TaxID=1470561 RepID=UPI000BB4574C|nr:cryptochrome/photolyase family protein [Boseongicola aestuarii]
MVSRLILVLGDQLSPDVAALKSADKSSDIIVMAEVADEAAYVPHHPKKIAFLFAAMRHFAQTLRDDGWTVDYTQLDDAAPHASIGAALLAAAERHGTSKVVATEPGEWRLISHLNETPLEVTQKEDDRFVATRAEFEAWAEGRKELRLEWFYRDMRRKTGLLMESDKPAGDKWNFDHDNRKPASGSVDFSGPMQFTPDQITNEVLDLVEARFPENFGTLRPFWFGVTTTDARRALTHFIKGGLAKFGDYQDAMLQDEKFLWHSILSMYLNAGLLSPLEICRAAEQAWLDGNAPLNAVEGFIRQIIGWREFVRGIYFHEGPDYTSRNALGHGRALPALYWGGETKMLCLSQAIDQTRTEAYAHHIQRLMVTGNFALLAGIDPHEVHEWYLAVYADAYEWVEAPNTIGMSQFADGGVVGSKPYVSSGNYIDRMSDYCKSCAYSVKTKTGEGACPFNLLYWHFLDRHRSRFSDNPRMGNMYRTWDRMNADKRETILSEADAFLRDLESGKPV